jgi:hypothetical protein
VLEQIAESLGQIDPGITNVHSRTFHSKETWTVYPLNEQLFVVARNFENLGYEQAGVSRNERVSRKTFIKKKLREPLRAPFPFSGTFPSEPKPPSGELPLASGV